MYKPCHHGPLDGMCRWYFIYQMDWYSYVHLPSALELDYAILSYLSQYIYIAMTSYANTLSKPLYRVIYMVNALYLSCN